MLSKTENEVMCVVYKLCAGEGRCLIPPKEVLSHFSRKQKPLTEEKLERVLRALELDGYFELLSSDRKGEKMYVITLRAKGYAFRRLYEQEKRRFFLKLGWAVASAAIAFFVGMLLSALF
ncbi:MAG: hypothetical protein IJV80_02860 [Clostridia bacterium]|nr:hypothetical protein [Clostridia bacterium]